MENYSVNNYDQIMFNQNQINSCRKKLNFTDQTNNIGEFEMKQKKFKKNMTANVHSAQNQIPSYTKQEPHQPHLQTMPTQQQSIKIAKIPSNTKRNARERKRVRTINDYFSQLQKFLPHSKQITNSNGATTTVTSNKKLSKVETLKAAIDYIEYLLTFAPMSISNKVNLSSSLSSSPLSSASSTNTTILSPSSALTSPATSSIGSSLNDKLKTSQMNKQSSAQLLSSAQSKQANSNTKSKSTKTESSSPTSVHAPQFDNTLSPVATIQPITQTQPQPTQCLIKETSNEAILNPIDFNVNYNTTNTSNTNDYYYSQQQQCYNTSYYPSQFRTDYYVQQPQQQQQQQNLQPTSRVLSNTQTSYYSQYGSLDCSLDSSDQSMMNRPGISQLNSSSSSSLSSPDIQTSPEYIQRSANFNTNNYTTINYNNQEQNLLLNTTSYNPVVEYQINC